MLDRRPGESGVVTHTDEVSAPPELPALVVRALRMSLHRGYVQASRTETGRLLATLELRIAVRALLAGTTSITLDPVRPAEREVAPVGGWARVPVLLDRP